MRHATAHRPVRRPTARILAMKSPERTLFVVLGNQLFPPAELSRYRRARFFMAEDLGLCTDVRHHKQKIALFLAAMRSYRDELRRRRFDVHYEELPPGDREARRSYEDKLAGVVEQRRCTRLLMWAIVDKPFEQRIRRFADQRGLTLEFLPSPMFITSRADAADWFAARRPHMATFYQWQRRRLGVLLSSDGGPVGGRWSFDADNRNPLPRDQEIPPLPSFQLAPHVRAVIPLVNSRFAHHPGELSADAWWLPTTRQQALLALRRFLDQRFELFGPYEDALSTRDPFLFHSTLSPALNLGLITPRETLDRALAHAEKHGVRLSSLEGFVRQIIGWREFVRGVYQQHSERQEAANFFDHQRRLSDGWYDATTGLPPLDDAIRKTLRWGWAHHIERLMIIGNLMTLCEIEPRSAYRWFMEMFVDSSDWVMTPNVYGMGIFSDGGVFATKPYICGSNYVRKMGDYDQADLARVVPGVDAPWTAVLDGLYWRFIERHRDYFRDQARMAQMVAALERLDAGRRKRIIAAAEQFIQRATR